VFDTFQTAQHSNTPCWPTCTLPARQPTLIPFVAVTVVLDVNVVVGLVGGWLDVVEVEVEVLVLVDVLVGVEVDVGVLVGVLVGVGVGVGVGVEVGDEVLELQDTVNVTYMFGLVGVTVVLDGLMVQPGAVLAVKWALVPGG